MSGGIVGSTILPGYNPQQPFLATISKARFETSTESDKNVIHLELTLPKNENQCIFYETGDFECLYLQPKKNAFFFKNVNTPK